MFDHPDFPFQSSYKFERENKIFRGLMFILLAISFKSVFLFNLTNFIDYLFCNRLGNNDGNILWPRVISLGFVWEWPYLYLKNLKYE